MEAREASEGTRVNLNRAMPPIGRTPANHNSTTGSFFTNSSGVQCVYCNGDHYSVSRTKVISVND